MRLHTVGILTLLLALLLGGCAKPLTVRMNDTVLVEYIGSFENGTVFDTNVVAAATDAGLFNAERIYEPLRVTIGQDQVIFGFEDGLKGMTEGEEKWISVPPELGYGKYSRGKVLTTRLERDLPRTLTLERTASMANLTLGQQVRLQDTFWPSSVIAMTERNVTFRQDPEEGSTIQTPLGPALITLTEETVRTRLLLEPGGTLRTQQGVGRILSVNETDATLDFNHPLAGETLIFYLKVLKIERP